MVDQMTVLPLVPLLDPPLVLSLAGSSVMTLALMMVLPLVP